WRALAYAGALAFGAVVGVLRMAAGAHFFSDVVFAGVISFLVIWLVHGWLYRWPRTRISDEAGERAVGGLEPKRGAAARATQYCPLGSRPSMNCPYGSGRFSSCRPVSDKPVLYGFLQARSSLRVTL